MNILEEIYNYKLDFVRRAKILRSLDELIDQSNTIKKKEFEFSTKLKMNKKINIIGELKKASPSAGNIIDDNIDIMEIAKTYDDIGVSCFSILTDEKYFNGSLNDLINLRKNTKAPILRKEFIVDEYQVYEAFISGADCILIILSMIDLDLAKRIENVAISLGLDAIIEVQVLSNSASSVAFYTIPDNLESNAMNENSDSFTLGTIRTHYESICENLENFSGKIHGNNNLRDLGNVVPFGELILQQSAPVTLMTNFINGLTLLLN